MLKLLLPVLPLPSQSQMPRAGSTTRAVLDCMVILSREEGGATHQLLQRENPSLSDPSIRFEKKVCQVHEGFAGIKAGPRKGGRTSARTDRSWAYFCCAGPIEIQPRVDNAKSR